ncbi:rod shape-determining protein MreC [Candidatus Parcubacteria bacterium]|nr:rod shape-determining protein MreC [Candidatus Parcubacteria bacterium]
MKTTFRKNNSSQSTSGRILIIIALFIVGAIVFPLTRGFLYRVLSPVWKGENAFSRGVKNLSDFFRSKEALIQENENLKAEIAAQDNLVLSCRVIEGTKDSLLSTYGREASDAGIAATVISRPPKTSYDVLVIDAGKENNISVGETVSVPEGPILGKVFESFSNTSQVVLFTTSGEKTDAILERNLLPVTLVGKGGGNFEMILPRTAEVEVGDKILSSPIDPRLMAVVGDVEETPTEGFKKALASVPVNLQTLRFVSISHN